MSPKDLEIISRRHRLWKIERVVTVLSWFINDKTKEDLTNVVTALSEEDLNKTHQAVTQFCVTEGIRYTAKTFAKHGWFMDMEFPGAAGTKIADLFEQGKARQADDTLSEYYRGRIKNIEASLVCRYSNRASLLQKAFRFHASQEYDLSVPMFFIQADGICWDFFGKDFFRVKNNALLAKKSVENMDVDWVWKALSEPFRTIFPLVMHMKPNKTMLNRHLVLHGRVVNYGIEINSLKAISLLSFLESLHSYAREKKSRQSPATSCQAQASIQVT